MSSDNHKLVHDIRNCQNSLRLNSAYLEKFPPQDVLDCMDGLIEAADRLAQIMIPLSEDTGAESGSPSPP